MKSEFDLECLISDLERAEKHAIRAGLDQSVVSEIRHLQGVAEANRSDEP